MFRLFHRGDAFFGRFEQSANNAHQGVRLLRDLMNDFVDVPAKVQAIKDLEHANDRVTHELADQLNRHFVTPLDREDIHLLSSRLDDVMDLADATASRVLLYRLQAIRPDAQALADVLVDATAMLKEAVGHLRNISKARDQILHACVEVNTYENQGDLLYQHGLAELFESGTSPIEIIKWMDIYNMLENNIDKCEDVANVIEAIVIKNS
jgi:predicted phosphate transport protein (TIGR00153 family)